MEPIKLISPLKDYLWGGTKLKSEYNKQTNLEKVAESWELSCHKDGTSIIANGEYKGKTLTEYINTNRNIILGINAKAFEYFPILIKLIDAKDNLSVQVHPSNEYAQRVEGEYGKTEMWYIVDCEENASLLYGFNKTITKEEYANHIKNNTLLDVANKVNVKKGDCFFIEAGTLHAIGSGILIAEIQQNSNTTYRVYDYGRTDANGNPRELHIEKAQDVTTLEKPTKKPGAMGPLEQFNGYSKTLLAMCEYFTVFDVKIDTIANLEVDATSFKAILCLEGDLMLNSVNGDIDIKKGETLFLPANFGNYSISGKGHVIISNI